MAIRVFIDAGHGGSETGAVSNGYTEKDLNLKVSLLLEQELKRCGFEVEMSRKDDSYLGVTERGVMALNNNATCLVSVHFNAGGGTGAKGCEFIYSFGNNSAQWIAQAIFEEVTQLGLYPRGVWTKESSSYPGHNYYGVLRGCEPLASVICEGLFLDNLNDIEFLNQPDFLNKLAICYCKGICNAYGIAYVENKPITEQPEPAEQTPVVETNKPWEQIEGEKALDNLFQKGLIKDIDAWKAKDLKNKQTPLWLLFLMFDRLSNK